MPSGSRTITETTKAPAQEGGFSGLSSFSLQFCAKNPPVTPMPHAYGPELRLKKRRDFLGPQSSGKKLYTRHFLILVSPSPTGRNRLGITITKKVDKSSVHRNRLRRRIREIFRLNQADFTSPIDMVVIARNESTKCDYEEIRREIMGVLGKERRRVERGRK